MVQMKILIKSKNKQHKYKQKKISNSNNQINLVQIGLWQKQIVELFNHNAILLTNSKILPRN